MSGTGGWPCRLPSTPAASLAPPSHVALQAEPAEPYTLLDADTMQVLPAAVAELLSGTSTDFCVVGALGAQGLGKSAFLNALLGFSGPLPAAGPHPSPAFPTAAATAVAAGRHCTRGLTLRVGSGRLIGLDAQPLFSASVLEDMMATWLDQPPPALAAPAVAAASEAKAPAVPYEGVQALAQLQLAVLVSVSSMCRGSLNGCCLCAGTVGHALRRGLPPPAGLQVTDGPSSRCACSC